MTRHGQRRNSTSTVPSLLQTKVCCWTTEMLTTKLMQRVWSILQLVSDRCILPHQDSLYRAKCPFIQSQDCSGEGSHFPLWILHAAPRQICLVENSRVIVTVSTDGCYLCSLCPVQEPWNRENTLFPSSFSYQVGAWSDGMNTCCCTFFPMFACVCFALAFHSLSDMSWHVDIYPNSLIVQQQCRDTEWEQLLEMFWNPAFD